MSHSAVLNILNSGSNPFFRAHSEWRSVSRLVSLAVEPFLGFLPRFLYMYYRFRGFFLIAVGHRDRGQHHDKLIGVQSACRRVRPIYGLKTRFLAVLNFSLLSLWEVRSDDRKRPLTVFIKWVHITRIQYWNPYYAISKLPWLRPSWVPIILTAKPAEALLSVGSPKSDRSRGQEPDEERCLVEGKADAVSSDASKSDISSDMKHRANDAIVGSWTCSKRSDHSSCWGTTF